MDQPTMSNASTEQRIKIIAIGKILFAGLLLAGSVSRNAHAVVYRSDPNQTFKSPDGSMIGVIKISKELVEATIQSVQNVALATKTYKPLNVTKGQMAMGEWTSDGAFFVFSFYDFDAYGNSRTHTFAFITTLGAIYSVNDYIGTSLNRHAIRSINGDSVSYNLPFSTAVPAGIEYSLTVDLRFISLKTLENRVETSTDTAKLPGLMYSLGTTYYDVGSLGKSFGIFTDVIKRYPTTRYATDADRYLKKIRDQLLKDRTLRDRLE